MLLVIVSLLIINVFISRLILNIYVEQRKSNVLIRANIVANETKNYLTTNAMSNINSIAEEYSKEISGRIIVVDRTGVVRGDSNKEYLGSTFRHTEIQYALKGQTSANIYNFKDYGHVLYVSVPAIFHNRIVGAILISVSINDIYREVSHINQNLYLISAVSIVLIAFISFIFLDFTFRPLESFTKAIDGMTKGDFKQKVEINTNDEFKNMADAFNAMIMKLDQVDKQRNDFVANVSHELRTPISSIKLLSDSLLHQNEDNISIYREFMEDISAEADRLNNIIYELLALVDLDKEKLHINYKTTYMNFLLEKIVNRMRPLAEKKNIKLTLEQDERIQIKVDSEKIQQAIINIIDNAIKYTSEYGKVQVKLYSQSKWCVIEVKDNGIGIPENRLSQIFDRFYRVDKARSRKTGGTGLGLSISQQIVSLHQGIIEVESVVDKGSIFYIKIPNDINL
ncbi:ATP-binding protein [Proteiniborus sp. DW1]|uniref:sensor histidine kinase n=1 Tax=Proteiniborus sp. DW1 TaxID=1889883 RepID=UPI001FA865DD|nr:ATP-binding protein [Proteiniborus sp. DW1]